MGKKKTSIDLVLALPNALTQAVLAAMTPSQKSELTASQAGAILTVTTQAAGQIAEILEKGGTIGDPRDAD